MAFGDGHYGSPREYQAIYKSTGSRIVYALRHIGHGNGYCSAFRYELERDVTRAGLVVKVQVYYLGVAGEFTMEQIGDEAWWTRRHRDVKTIYFSNPGYADLSGSSYLGSSPGYGEDPRYGGYMGRFGRRGLLRPGGYRQPTILEQGRTAYYTGPLRIMAPMVSSSCLKVQAIMALTRVFSYRLGILGIISLIMDMSFV